jgi:hypothetical protein
MTFELKGIAPMQRFILLLFMALCALIFVACAGNTPAGTTGAPTPFAIDSEATVTGAITGVITDCSFDGICALVLDVNGTPVNAIWAEGMLQCSGEYPGDVAIGATVEVFGVARDANSLSICPGSEYYVRVMG